MSDARVWSAVLLGSLLSGCQFGWSLDSGGAPPERADCVLGTLRCAGRHAFSSCSHYSDGDYTYWAVSDCPGTSLCQSFEDHADACVLDGVTCDVTAASTCVDGHPHECVGAFVLPNELEHCAEEAACITVPKSTLRVAWPRDAAAETAAVCAVDSTPCERFVRSECRDGAVVECSPFGYPISWQECPSDARCTEGELRAEQVGRCNEAELPCPPEDRTACSDNRVYTCVGVFRSVSQDCASKTCVDVGGYGACYLSPEGPSELEWRAIPGGEFALGDPASSEPRPLVRVESFEMLRVEVTAGQFMSCVATGACSARYGTGISSGDFNGDLPVALVDAMQAKAFCRTVGGDLPTAHEWEYVARNAGAEVSYPWGEGIPTCTKAVVRTPVRNGDQDDPNCFHRPALGCSRAPDITTQGVCDLVGNVAEWVLELPEVPDQTAVRGGDALTDPTYFPGITVHAQAMHSDTSSDTLRGFRCVRR
jgi:formylglycine-generating enzyme required for sulfatase activity